MAFKTRNLVGFLLVYKQLLFDLIYGLLAKNIVMILRSDLNLCHFYNMISMQANMYMMITFNHNWLKVTFVQQLYFSCIYYDGILIWKKN